jgi:hypothetical protein
MEDPGGDTNNKIMCNTDFIKLLSNWVPALSPWQVKLSGIGLSEITKWGTVPLNNFIKGLNADFFESARVANGILNKYCYKNLVI